jgi:hypothetical protein
VRVNSAVSETFEQFIGLRQGCVLSPFLFSFFIDDLPTWLGESQVKADGTVLGPARGVWLDDVLVRCLMYADDIALTAETAEDLQLMLDKLELFCDLWRLLVNIQKTEVVVFRPAKSLVSDDVVFLFRGRALNKVDSFKYLGIVFKSDGSMVLAIERVLTSARKAFFLYARRCSTFMLDAAWCVKLYETFIFSILSYGAELWGVDHVKLHWKKLEEFQTMVGRFILRAPRTSPTAGILGELGWQTVRCRALCRAVRYWSHVCALPPSRLVTAAMRVNTARASAALPSWLLSLNASITESGLSQFESQALVDQSVRKWAGVTCVGLKEYDEKIWRATLDKENSKLRSFKLFKTGIRLEPYLSMHISVERRSLLTRFRLGIAPLRIETGRWKKEQLDCRVCTLCRVGDVEDEMHVVMSCSRYSDLRFRLISVALQVYPAFYETSITQRFVYLMACEDLDLTRALAEFLQYMFDRRMELSAVPDFVLLP